MTREEAKRILNRVLEEWVMNDDVSIPREEALRVAIKALEQPKGDALSEIEKLPPVKQEPKTGRWIADVFVDECSVCGEQTLFFEDQHKNFCPNCGAKMESEVSE